MKHEMKNNRHAPKYVEEYAQQKQPLFYQHLPAFVHALPTTPDIQINTNTVKNNDTLQIYIDSYLSHYAIHFTDSNSTGSLPIAKTHTLWRNQLSSYLPDVHNKHGSQKNISGHYHIVQQYWEPLEKAEQTGTIIIAHGYLDHTGLYGPLIQWALKQGYHVLAFDLPGHGLSSGEPAAIDHFDQYTNILWQVIGNTDQQRTLPKPLHIIGQSTGCAIIANALLDHTTPHANLPIKENTETIQNIEHVILLAPLIRSRKWALLRWLYFLLKPWVHDIKRAFTPSSHNQHFQDFIHHHDPLQSQRICLSWLGAMELWYKDTRISNLTTPTISTATTPSISIIQGTADNTVDWHYNIPVLQHHFNNSHLHYVEGAGHHLVNEAHHYWQAIEKILSETLKEA